MTAQELRDKFEFELSQLQLACPHEKTEVIEYSYAPGHFTGSMVEVCKNCEKVLRKVTT